MVVALDGLVLLVGGALSKGLDDLLDVLLCSQLAFGATRVIIVVIEIAYLDSPL